MKPSFLLFSYTSLNLQALVVALNTVGAVSINRTHEIVSSAFSIPLATETIKNMVSRFAGSLSGIYERIRQQAGVLPLYQGIIVHDCWGSYWKYKIIIRRNGISEW